MNQKYTPELIIRYCGLTFHDHWKQAIKLQSENTDNNNSRYIFWTQFAFRGIVAEYIFEHIGGSGTQLQHYLGNITSDKWYAALFDKFGLATYVSKEHYSEHNKHLYAQGFVGWLLTRVTQDRLISFIHRFFLVPNDHFLPNTFVHRDDWQILQLLCKQNDIPKPKMQHFFDEADKGHTIVCICNGTTYQHTSVSFKYAKKKAIKMALKAIVMEFNQTLMSDEQYLERQKIKEEEAITKQMQERSERIRQWKEKQAQKAVVKAVRKKEKAEKAILEDKKRRAAKLKVKEKIQKKQSVYRVYTAEEIANMTTGKRRRLEDLGILPKR